MKEKYSLEIGKYLVVKIDGMFDLYLVEIVSVNPLIVKASESSRHSLNLINAKRFKIEERPTFVLQQDFKNKTENVFKTLKNNVSLVTNLPRFSLNNQRLLTEVKKLH